MNEEAQAFHAKIQEIEDRWDSVFGIRIPTFSFFMDRFCTGVFRKPKIDIGAFDEYMRRKFHYDTDREISLSDFLEEKFGDEAKQLVRECL